MKCIQEFASSKMEKQKHFYEETKVTFYEISDEQIDRYIKTGEPMDKAGSYGIQGKAAVFIKGIEGDYYKCCRISNCKDFCRKSQNSYVIFSKYEGKTF